MRFAISLCLFLVMTAAAWSQETTESTVKADFLALLRQQQQTPVVQVACNADIWGMLDKPAEIEHKTMFLAALQQRPVLIFVGGCSESVRRDFPDVAVVALPSYRGVSDRRLVVPKDGNDWYWLEGDITPNGVQQLLGVSRSAARDGSPRCESGDCDVACENGICRVRRPASASARRGRGCASCGD